MEKAKVFWSGRSQAVRLPKEFRVHGKEMRIRRHGTAIILEPVESDWVWLEALTGTLDEDFIHAVGEQPADRERQDVDDFFR